MTTTAFELCNRFKLSLEHTGGGCWSLYGELGTVNYVAISDEQMQIPDSLGEPITVFVARTREQLEDACAWDDGAIEIRNFSSTHEAIPFLQELEAER